MDHRLQALFGSNDPTALSNTDIADILATTPEALDAFNRAYRSFEQTRGLSDNFFAVNSRQATAMTKDPAQIESISEDLVKAISSELLGVKTLTTGDEQVAEQMGEIEALPARMRPQLTATAMVKDISTDAYPAIVSVLAMAQAEPDPAVRENMTLQAIAMMDTLDLDPVVYEMLSRNPASMGHWFPALEHAVSTTGFFRVPKTTVARVPLPVLQMTRLDYARLTPTTLAIIDAWAREAFALDPAKKYFIKTGTYSSKFDFRNCKITDPAEVNEIGRYLTYIHFQANQMASPLTLPHPVAGVSTTNEWVVREWIEDESVSPEIYHGMPLRTEFRVFVDCDDDRVLAVAPYWDPEIMLDRFENRSDADDPDQRHDAIVFRAHLPVLMERFERFKDVVADEVTRILPELDLTGQWSLDIMLNDASGEQFYAIDMAPAASSALSHHVPDGLLHSQQTDWLPRIGK